MTGSGFLPRPPIGKHKSTAASRADDVKRRDAVYREGLADALKIMLASPNMIEGARRIREAMNA